MISSNFYNLFKDVAREFNYWRLLIINMTNVLLPVNLEHHYSLPTSWITTLCQKEICYYKLNYKPDQSGSLVWIMFIQ